MRRFTLGPMRSRARTTCAFDATEKNAHCRSVISIAVSFCSEAIPTEPMETIEQFPFVLCAWPSFADQSYITNYRIYDDRVGETTRFTYRPDHEWYWFPRQTPTEVSMLKCYDSVTDGSVSRWSFHTSSIDPTVPLDAPCRKNVVVRSRKLADCLGKQPRHNVAYYAGSFETLMAGLKSE